MSRSNRALAIATAVLAGSVILFAFVLTRAVTVDTVDVPDAPIIVPPAADTQATPVEAPKPVPRSPAPPSENHPGEKGSGERLAGGNGQLSGEAIALLVRNDPFSPTRQPSEPYRLPGEEVSEEAPATPMRLPPPPQIRVFGTVIAPSGGIALLQIEDTRRVMSVGESVSGFRLAHVDAQTATVEANGRMITYRVEDPSPRRPTRNARSTQNGQNGQNGQNAQTAAQQARAEQARQQVLRNAIERLQQMDMESPELRAQIMQMLRGNLEVPERAIPLGNTNVRIVPRQDTSGTRHLRVP